MNKQTEITKLRFREQELLLDKESFTITEINKILLEVDTLFNNESKTVTPYMTTSSDTSSLIDNTETPEQLFKSIMSKITGTKKLDKYPECVFHMVGDKNYMEQNLKSGNINIRNRDFWSVFETKFGLNHQEISDLLRGLLEEHLKCNVNTTRLSALLRFLQLEEHLKCNVNTTACLNHCQPFSWKNISNVM